MFSSLASLLSKVSLARSEKAAKEASIDAARASAVVEVTLGLVCYLFNVLTIILYVVFNMELAFI